MLIIIRNKVYLLKRKFVVTYASLHNLFKNFLSSFIRKKYKGSSIKTNTNMVKRSGVYYHQQLTTKSWKFEKKFIDKAKQGVYTGVLKGAEFKNGLYFVLRPVFHFSFLMWALSGK